MGIAILLGSLGLLMVLGFPIAFSLLLSSVLSALYLDIPLLFLFQKMVNALDSFTFMAVPYFVLAAEVMLVSGISDRLIQFAGVLVGRVRGGTAMVNVVTSMFFGGISGSSVADVSSVGSFLIPAMEREGYDKDYSVAVTVTSSVQGVIIPPSQNMIYYAIAVGGGVSVNQLFLAGYIPGIMLGLALMVVTYFIARRRAYPLGRKYGLAEGWRISVQAIPGLFTIVIIIGGVISGVFTATESAAVAALYALLLALFYYRNISLREVCHIFVRSLNVLTMIIAVISTSAAFGFMLAYLKIPLLTSQLLLSLSDNKVVILLTLNLLLLVLGMLMDMGVLILLLTPILLPVATSIGLSPIHFGIIMILNLGLGLCTPPVGTSLFVGCAIAKLKVEDAIRAMWPFYLTMIALLVVLSIFPVFSLGLPALLAS